MLVLIIYILIVAGGMIAWLALSKKRQIKKQHEIELEKLERINKLKNAEFYQRTLEECKRHIARRLNEIENDMATKPPSQWDLKGLRIVIFTTAVYIEERRNIVDTIEFSDFYIELDIDGLSIFTSTLYRDIYNQYKEFEVDIIQRMFIHQGDIEINFDKNLKDKIKKF